MAKKNIYKIPGQILKKLETIDGKEVIVGCAVKFKAEDLASGELKHLGIVLTEKGLNLPTSIIPPDSQGKYSDRNINGFEVTRKDLPKETHYHSVETPNWGDSYNGTHTVDLPHEKYPRDFHSPRELEIFMKAQDVRPGLPTYIISFQVQEVLSKNDDKFNDYLFDNLNLLQENVGAFGVQEATMPLADYVKSLHVSWEILPPGTLEETIQRVFRGKTPNQQLRDVTTERYNFFQSLNPKNLVFGSSGFRRYFGAQLEDDLVVFENVEYGNAVYILFNNWEELSKLSRLELMSGQFGNSFERIVHTGDWEESIRKVVATKRAEQKLVAA